MPYYKILRKDAKHNLISYFSAQDLIKMYRLEAFTYADKVMFNAGYGLFVYNDIQGVLKEFKYEKEIWNKHYVYECEVEGIIRLPKRHLPLTDKRDILAGGWVSVTPFDEYTVCVHGVKLVKEVFYEDFI